MAKFTDLLDKGVKFFPAGPTLAPQDITHWETIIDSPLPEQYRDYLLHANGGRFQISADHIEPVNNYAFPVVWPEGLEGMPEGSLIRRFYSLETIPSDKEGYTQTLEFNYNAWEDNLPKDTLPIAGDPGGRKILIGLRGERKGKIFFWLLEGTDPREEPEVAAYGYVGLIANSFVEFIHAMEYVGKYAKG